LLPTVQAKRGWLRLAIQDVTRSGDIVLDLPWVRKRRSWKQRGPAAFQWARYPIPLFGLRSNAASGEDRPRAAPRWSLIVNKKSSSGAKPNPGWVPQGSHGIPREPVNSRPAQGSPRRLVEKDPHGDHHGATREITVEEDALAGGLIAMRWQEREWPRAGAKGIMKREAWMASMAPRNRPADDPAYLFVRSRDND